MFKLFSFHCPEKDSYMIKAVSIRQWAASIQTARQPATSLQTARQWTTSLQTVGQVTPDNSGSPHSRQPDSGFGHIIPEGQTADCITPHPDSGSDSKRVGKPDSGRSTPDSGLL